MSGSSSRFARLKAAANTVGVLIIATGVVIACFVDVGRLAVYFSRFQGLRWDTGGPILVYATLAAFAGALVGRQLLRKLTLGIIQWTVAIGIILLGLTLLVGLL